MNQVASKSASNEALNKVLKRMASEPRLRQEHFVALAEHMPIAFSVGAAAMETDVQSFKAMISAGGLKPLPVMLAMAAHIHESQMAH